MPYNKCLKCGNEFYAKPFWVKQGKAKYCSAACHHESMKKGRIIECYICGKKTYKPAGRLRNSKSNKFFCGKSCQTIWRNSMVYIGSKHPNWKGGDFVNYRNLLKKMNMRRICVCCKTRDERVLVVHHKDNRHRNNKIDNLTWLCHNCHFLVHRYEDERRKIMETLV